MTEMYEHLEWDIEDIPVGSSTPDELYELTFRAKAHCPHCGEPIDGMANYWSYNSDMFGSWLDRIEYTECDCQEVDDYYDDEED